MKSTKILTIALAAIVQMLFLLTPAQGQHFPGAAREGDRHLIRSGGERFEIPDAVLLGG